MPALTTPAENSTLNWLTGNGAPTDAPVLPLRVALVTVPGNDETPGTEVVGGDYARQPVTFGVADNGQCSNTGIPGANGAGQAVRFNNMPDIAISGDGTTGGVRGFEIWDSRAAGDGGPRRWWHAALTQARGYQAGDAAEFPVGELVLAMD